MDSDETGAYPPSWEADVVLTDGQTVHVRPIVPADADRLVAFHGRQSPESIYFRYFSPRPELSDRDVERFTHVDHRDRVAFVALAADELIGVARYERYGGTDTAEVAFFVDDAHNGRGLATLLLEYLAAAGKENGLRRFSATTLPNNRRMLSVFAAAGFQVASRIDDGVVEVAFDIDPTGDSMAAMDRRERRAEAASVRRMLRPESVAVVGAGRERGGLGAEVFHNLVANGFAGEVHPVNRNGGPVGGVESVPSVLDMPRGVDLVVVAAPAPEVLDIVSDCGERGVGGVIVMSAGFSESGEDGARLEQQLVETARHHGLRLLGPNCLGVINADPSLNLDATLAPSLPRAGRVAMLAESGTLAAAIVDHAVRMDLGVSTMVAAGNRADVSATDLLSYWIEDPATSGVLLYLAARSLPPRFVRAARAASLVMPVAALHTSMSSFRVSGDGTGGTRTEPRARSQAMFRQTGVIGVDTLEQLFDLGRLIADQPVPGGNGVVIVGNSDGAVALTADACLAAGLDLVPVRATGRSGASFENPIDLTYRASATDYERALDEVTADPRVHVVVVIYTPPRLDLDEDVVDVILSASAKSPHLTFASTMLGAAGRGRLCHDADPAGQGAAVPIFRFPEDAARALGRLARYRSWLRSAAVTSSEPLQHRDLDRARGVIDRLGPVESGAAALDHDDEAELLAAYQVEIIPRQVVDDVDAAVDAAEVLGWPVALKARQRDRLTRSAASGVWLDLTDADQLRGMWARMEAALDDGMTPAVVQQFVDHGIDVSVIVEREDDGTGTVRCGLGGPAAILGEFELGVLPLSLSDASSLVAGSPIARVLTDPLDRIAVVELVHRLASMVVELDTVRSVRADPVVCTPSTARVADVEVLIGPPVEDFAVRRLD